MSKPSIKSKAKKAASSKSKVRAFASKKSFARASQPASPFSIIECGFVDDTVFPFRVFTTGSKISLQKIARPDNGQFELTFGNNTAENVLAGAVMFTTGVGLNGDGKSTNGSTFVRSIEKIPNSTDKKFNIVTGFQFMNANTSFYFLILAKPIGGHVLQAKKTDDKTHP
ncbi:MAG: hypothetical protein HY244_04750 [Rhizobiales bacterium]|nr:hypothetical protein [Hyphomicrobiales bacterium]